MRTPRPPGGFSLRSVAKGRAVAASPISGETGGRQSSAARVSASSTCSERVSRASSGPSFGSLRSTAKAGCGTEKSRAGRPSPAARSRISSRRRQVGGVARQQYPPCGVGMHARAANEIDEIVDENQAATIVDPGEWQRQSARDEPHQRPEICLHSRTVDERRPQNDYFDARFPAPLFATRARLQACRGHKRRGARRSVGRNGTPGESHRPSLGPSSYGSSRRTPALPRRAPGPARPAASPRLSCLPARTMRAVGEMDYDLDPVEMPDQSVCGPISPIG